MRKSFSDLMRRTVGEAQNWTCFRCLKPIASYHHRLENTEVNHKKFPIFLNSPFNCVGLCQECHDQKSHLFAISLRMAEVYETWLDRLRIG